MPTSVFCRKQLEGATGGDSKFAAEVLATFLATFPEEIAQIERAATQRDERAIRYYARMAKASSLTVGANRLARFCFRLEKHLPIAHAAAMVKVLTDEIDYFSDHVRRLDFFLTSSTTA